MIVEEKKTPLAEVRPAEKTYRIICIDDDTDFLRILTKSIESSIHYRELAVELYSSPNDALEQIKGDMEDIAVILTDYQMPEMNGTQLIKELPRNNATQVILLSGSADEEMLRQVQFINIFDFINKTGGMESLLDAIDGAFDFFIRKRKTKNEFARLSDSISPRKISGLTAALKEFHGIFGVSDHFESLIEKIKKVAQSTACCLITGPSGAGKEKVAQAIHNESKRKDGHFVAINCAAISKELIESELFGHTKGAFTGAVSDKTGLFEFAAGGTIFLDEIGDMPPELQVKLLRVLQEKEVTPVGGRIPRPVDVRVLCATNKNLKQAVAGGTFREDLYYRLNVIEIEIPALERRAADIVPLFAHFVSVLADIEEVNEPPVITGAIAETLGNYTWPGNIRELQNTAHRYVIFGALPKEITGSQASTKPEKLSARRHEKLALLNAMEEAEGNKEKAAEILGVSRATLYRKLKSFDF